MLSEDFQTAGEGGLGFAVSETDDGKIVATFITQNGPAAIAGMKWGAEIISMDGVPTSTVVDKAIPWSSSSFSNPVIKRLQQLPYATRFKMDKGQVEVKFKNIGGNEQTVALDVVNEVDSFNIPSARSGISPTALPVEFDVLPSGYGYIKISSFLDNTILSIQVWERAIQYFNDNQVPGVILDLRNNGGGDSWLADQMAAYFFDKEIVVGSFATYSKDTGQFYSDPDRKSIMIPPRTELQYSGPVVVMVGPNCASACEFFSYNMTINDRAAIVGQYPSEGAGGGVEDFKMPEDITVRMTVGRKVDANGNIHIEGKGVVPTVRVPVTLDTLKKEANGVDVVLAVAEKAISQR
jgi:C-terminal processing protease CtpA/Prc